MTLGFNLRRFDFMEALLSLKFALKGESLPKEILKRAEGARWMNFITCYRLYLLHQEEISPEDRASLLERFETILHTFRPSQLSRKYRWKPGYWLFLSLRFFDLQQRTYHFFKKASPN